MNYELYPDSANDLNDIKGTVFANRKYKPPNGGFDDNVASYEMLKNMSEAVKLFDTYKDKRIGIVVDSDCDGDSSASILYRYIKKNFGNTPSYYLHSKKAHGLSDDLPPIENIDLLIIPDAGTNDAQQCKELYERGVRILILDHHIKERENPYAVIVNSQAGNYPNKELCGTGVTWQFLRALDEFYWLEDADSYLDVVTMATIADIMDVTLPENRTIIDCGLANITHPLFIALADKANTPVQTLTGYDCQFGIIPLINATIRVGTQEDKELLFKAFCCELEYFDYKKRGSDEIIEENIYDRAARLSYNARQRQKKVKNAELEDLIDQIERKKLYLNKLLVTNGTKTEQALTGMLASALADRYNKPCLVLRRMPDGNYGGSGRNSKISPVAELKPALEQTGMFEMIAGHNNAFGLEICKDKIRPMIELLNERFADVVACLYVDFIIDADDLTFDLIASICRQVMPYCGTGFEPPMIAVTNIEVRRDMIKSMAGGTSLKIITDNDVAIAKFGLGEDDPLRMWYESDKDDSIMIDVVGKCGMNYWGGIMSAQLVATEWDICS